MDLPDRIDLSTNQLHLDNFLKNHNLFSKQITNALVKQGIVTPRILIMHTAKLLRNIENLGPQLIADIISVLAKQGWSLVETADERYVTLTRRLIMVFSKVNRPLSLSRLTQMVNSLTMSH